MSVNLLLRDQKPEIIHLKRIVLLSFRGLSPWSLSHPFEHVTMGQRTEFLTSWLLSKGEAERGSELHHPSQGHVLPGPTFERSAPPPHITNGTILGTERSTWNFRDLRDGIPSVVSLAPVTEGQLCPWFSHRPFLLCLVKALPGVKPAHSSL